jgi:hypothetical protein
VARLASYDSSDIWSSGLVGDWLLASEDDLRALLTKDLTESMFNAGWLILTSF